MKKLMALILAGLLLTPVGLFAQDKKRDQNAIRTAFTGESINVSSFAVSVTTAFAFPSTPTTRTEDQRFATRADCTVSTDAIRYRTDGNAPTAANGLLIPVNTTFSVYGKENLQNLKMIRVTTDAVVFCQYSR